MKIGIQTPLVALTVTPLFGPWLHVYGVVHFCEQFYPNKQCWVAAGCVFYMQGTIHLKNQREKKLCFNCSFCADYSLLQTTVSTKRKYTLAAKPSTQNRGGLKEKYTVLIVHGCRGLLLGPTQWLVWRTPYFSSEPLIFEYLAQQKCIFSFGGDCKQEIMQYIIRLSWCKEKCPNNLKMSHTVEIS